MWNGNIHPSICLSILSHLSFICIFLQTNFSLFLPVFIYKTPIRPLIIFNISTLVLFFWHRLKILFCKLINLNIMKVHKTFSQNILRFWVKTQQTVHRLLELQRTKLEMLSINQPGDANECTCGAQIINM